MSGCVSRGAPCFDCSYKRKGKKMNEKLGFALLCILFCLPSVSFAGWLHDNTCYATEQEAVDAHFSSWVPVIGAKKKAVQVYHDAFNVAGVWHLNEYEIRDGIQAMSLVHSIPFPVPTFATCIENSFVTAAGIQKSFEFGFYVVAALASFGLVIGFALLAIKKL